MYLPRILVRPGTAHTGVFTGTFRRAVSSPSPFTPRSFSSALSSSRPPPLSSAAPSLLVQLSRRRLTDLSKRRCPLSIRWASTAKPLPRKIPERILIYHAGTPRATFLACLKVTTLFGLAFFTFLVAPAYIVADKPWPHILAIVACGIVPFTVIAYTSQPFVVFIHLRLPAFARHPDPELLRRFVRNIPAATKLDITTMNLVGRPRVTSLPVGDILPAHERMRIVNFIDSRQRVLAPPAAAPTSTSRYPTSRPIPAAPPLPKPQTKLVEFSSAFPWIHLRPATKFGAPVGNNSRGVKDSWVWDEVLAGVERKAARAQQPKA